MRDTSLQLIKVRISPDWPRIEDVIEIGSDDEDKWATLPATIPQNLHPDLSGTSLFLTGWFEGEAAILNIAK